MRYGLGALLLAVMLPNGAWADEAAAVKQIEKLGGWVIHDERQPGNPVVVAGDLGDAHVRDVRALRTREAAVELAAHLGFDSRRAMDVVWLESGLPGDDVDNRLRRPVRLDHRAATGQLQRRDAEKHASAALHAKRPVQRWPRFIKA